MAAEYQVDVKLDPSKAEQGARRVGAALDGVATSASHARDEVARFTGEGKSGFEELGEAAKTAFEFYAIKEAITELSALSDSYTTIQNKLRSVSSDQANLNGLTEATYSIAQETRTEWDEVANAYQRLGKATEHMGYSQRDVLDLTRTLTQAMIVSGATAQEAAMSLQEITHGFEIGTLQGREFKVLLKDATPIIGDLANALHMSRAAFIEMGKHGKLTAELLGKAFKDAGPEIQAQFNKMAPTIGQTFTVLENAAKKFFGELMTGSGILHEIADATKFVVDHFEVFGKILVTIGETVGVYFGVKMIGLAVDGLRTLALAAASNPLGALLLVIVAGVAALRQFGDQLSSGISVMVGGKEVFASMGDVLRATWEVIKDIGSAIADFITGAWQSLKEAFSDGLDGTGVKTTLGDVLRFIATFVATGIEMFRHFKDVVTVVFADIPVELVNALLTAYPAIKSIIESIGNTVLAISNKIQGMQGLMRANTIERLIPDVQEKQDDAIANEMAAKKRGDAAGVARAHAEVIAYSQTIQGMMIERDKGYAAGDAKAPTMEIDMNALSAMARAARDQRVNITRTIEADIEKDVGRWEQYIQKYANMSSTVKKTVGDKGGPADPESPDEKAAKARAKLQNEYLQVVGQSNPIAEAEYKIAKAQDIVNRAVDAGIASWQEGEQVMDNFREKLKDQLDPYAAYITLQLKEEAALRMNSREREQFLAVQAAEQKLRKEGVTLTEEQSSRIEHLTKKLIEMREESAQQEKVLKDIQSPSYEYLTTIRTLDALLKDHKITLDEYAKAVTKTKEAYVETTPAALSFEHGVMQGLKAIAAQTLDVAGSVKSTMVNAFNGVNTALTDLIVKGKADWHSLVQSMEADVTQLILKMLELKLFQAVVPGGSIPGFATGGSFMVGGTGGTDTQLVAFRATPGERVTVQTPGQQNGGGASQKGGTTVVNLRSVNVTDPNQAIHAVDSRQGERVFTNFVRRNPGLLRGITGTRR